MPSSFLFYPKTVTQGVFAEALCPTSPPRGRNCATCCIRVRRLCGGEETTRTMGSALYYISGKIEVRESRLSYVPSQMGRLL